MIAGATILKDPDAVKDYLVDLGREMANTSDTIATIVTVTATPSGLTVGTGGTAPSIVAGRDENGAVVASGAVKLWLSAGALGTLYAVLCRVTTTGGRTLDHTGYVRVVAR